MGKYFFAPFCLLLGLQSFAETNEYPTTQERTRFQEDLNRTLETEPQIHIQGYEDLNDVEQTFVNYFAEMVFPLLYEIRRQEAIMYHYSVASDRALFKNDEEKLRWQAKKVEALNRREEILSGNEFKNAIARWHELSQGLNGELVDLAERLKKEDDLIGLSEEQVGLQEEINQLMAEVSQIANDSEVTGEMLKAYSKTVLETEQKFRAGEISFTEANAKLNSVWLKGHHAKGHDVRKKAADKLNRVAILRTKLAQAKGFENWAQYMHGAGELIHQEGFQTPEDHIRFMSSTLEQTREAHGRFTEWVNSQHPEIPSDSIHAGNSFLLLPETGTVIAKFFPVEKVNETWVQTMIESGFDQALIDQIVLDSFPREGKQTHAYMSDTVPRLVKTVVVDGLDLVLPSADLENWHPAVIHIVQNAKSDGPGSYETVWHEGGHGLDFASRLEVVHLPRMENKESYGYSETASMTMERFFWDKDFLLAKGLSRDGERLTPEAVDEYIRNSKLISAVGSRGQVKNALFDMLIWNEAYTEDGPSFIDRMNEINDELLEKYFPWSHLPLPTGVTANDRNFSTGHFYGGDVRYYGYIYADIAAQMTADYLWDTLEASTGRRSFLNQPSLGPILTQCQYERGFCEKFPGATEKLTGKTFEPENLSNHINETVKIALSEGDTSDCDQAFR